MLIRDEIARLVAEAAVRAQEVGDLPTIALPDVTVEHPAHEEHGDYAVSLPMKLARAARNSPLAIAEAIAKHISPGDTLAEVSVAAPGFINFRLAEEDLRLRGPGEYFGTRQTGLPDLKVARLSDIDLLEQARAEAARLLESDAELARPEHRPLARQVSHLWGSLTAEVS